MKAADRELIIEGLRSRIAKLRATVKETENQLQEYLGKISTKKLKNKKPARRKPKMSAERRAQISECMKELHRKRKAKTVENQPFRNMEPDADAATSLPSVSGAVDE